MRIHRLTLRHFRGVEECEVAFDVNGVTIIEGDNEVGKTCIPEAIDLILDYPHSSAAGAVVAVRPVHLDEGPEVELEMSAGPYHLVYKKRWHRKPETTLDVTTPNREQLTGRDAHDRVQAILDETVDATLWAALRLDQGVELTQAALADAPTLARALDAAAGGDTDVAGDREDDLWTRICDERKRYWTPTGKPSKERTTLAEGSAQAETKVRELRQSIEELADDADEVARLTDELAETSDQLDRQRATATSLDAEWKQTAQQVQKVEKLAAELSGAVARQEKLVAEQETRATGVAAAERHRQQLDALTSTRAEVEPQRVGAETGVTEADEAMVEAEGTLAVAEAALQQARADRDLRKNQFDLELLTERQGRVEEAQADLGHAEKVLEANAAHDDALDEIEQAQLTVVQAEAVANQAATSVSVTALGDTDITIADETVSLAEGTETSRTVEHELHVTVPGVAHIAVRSGGETQSLTADVHSAREQLAALCTAIGVTDVEAARAANKAHSEAELQRDTALATIERDVRDLTPKVLTDKTVRLREQIAEAETSRTGDTARTDAAELPVDLETAESVHAEAEERVASARGALDALRRDLDAARTKLNQIQVADASAEAEIAQLTATLERAEAALVEARASRPDAGIEHEVEEATTTRNALQERHDSAAAELESADPDSLKARLDNANNVVERTEITIGEREVRRQKLVVTLELAGEKGLAHELDDAQTTHAHLGREHERLEARAAAAMLLHETVGARRDAARQRYVAPLRERIEKLGRIVFGPKLEIGLDDDLRIAQRTLGGVTLEFSQLSVGAREQLGIISRLACAQLVSGEGGAPVIFDDALGWSDPSRLERMGAVIASATGDCQVVVLTCTPGRYASVGNATVITLPS